MIKLSVGSDSFESLAAWQESRAHMYADGYHRHTTRMWPKREADILDGGSIYWVIKGVILGRQRIVRFDEVRRHDGVRMCSLILDRDLVRVAPTPKRAFQGWRYLDPKDAPPDLSPHRLDEEPLPPDMSAELAKIGVL
ncbi:MAG: DUF1489 domain-containing protein [Pseudomonadota bacterium]